MSDPSPQSGGIPVEVSMGVAVLAASVMRARISRARSWVDVAIDVPVTAALVFLAFHALMALPARWGGPVPEDIAVIGAAVVGMLGWEALLRFARRVLGLSATRS